MGSELRSFHAEERSVSGLIAKAIREPSLGQWIERTPEFMMEALSDTILEWKDSVLVRLDADAERLWVMEQPFPPGTQPTKSSFLSDDQ